MPKLAGVNHQRAVKAFQKAGFWVVREGRHITMTNGVRIITIPRANPVDAFTMAGIVKDAGLSNDEFKKIIIVPELQNVGFRIDPARPMNLHIEKLPEGVYLATSDEIQGSCGPGPDDSRGPDLMTLPFLQHAFFAALLASLACGIVGSFVTVNRITYMAGAIAHSVLGGMGIARYLQHEQGILWMTPLVGAVLAALAAAVVISLVREIAREREDTVLSAVWSVGMATGILRLSAMILVAVIVSGLCSSGGLLLSYVADTPSGATIILLTGMAYGSVLAGRWIASSVGRA